MNSRQTAAILGTEPNGSYKATDASMVPLTRMSNTVFGPGSQAPGNIIAELDHGYYLIGIGLPPSPNPARTSASPRKRCTRFETVKSGSFFRRGGMTADTKDFLMKVDAMGTDFRLNPIPNCGKGQPMQTERLGNGAPTMRSRARLTGL